MTTDRKEAIAPRLLEYLTLRAQCKAGPVEQKELVACVIMVNEAMRQQVILECATNAVIASAFQKDKSEGEPRKLSLDTARDRCTKM